MPDINQLLNTRAKTHGPFIKQAAISQNLKMVIDEHPFSKFEYLKADQREAVEMILHKISRALCGNADEVDHWDDIAGYATLVANRLREEAKCES